MAKKIRCPYKKLLAIRSKEDLLIIVKQGNKRGFTRTRLFRSSGYSIWKGGLKSFSDMDYDTQDCCWNTHLSRSKDIKSMKEHDRNWKIKIVLISDAADRPLWSR